jgi:hypothetical protein
LATTKDHASVLFAAIVVTRIVFKSIFRPLDSRANSRRLFFQTVFRETRQVVICLRSRSCFQFMPLPKTVDGNAQILLTPVIFRLE